MNLSELANKLDSNVVLSRVTGDKENLLCRLPRQELALKSSPARFCSGSTPLNMSYIQVIVPTTSSNSCKVKPHNQLPWSLH
jgi:hypothetical protein